MKPFIRGSPLKISMDDLNSIYVHTHNPEHLMPYHKVVNLNTYYDKYDTHKHFREKCLKSGYALLELYPIYWHEWELDGWGAIGTKDGAVYRLETNHGQLEPKRILKTLLIDDMRDLDIEMIARNFDDGIQALESCEVGELYLDHDLGDPDPNKTGYGIMKFLEENPQYLPKKITIVSSNPVGRYNIQAVIDKLYGARP